VLTNVLKIILFLLVLRMLYPLFKSMGAMSGKPSTPGSGRPKNGGDARDYSDLTSYEIEDADFEEIKKK
jgi:hypothetical protein